jgi:hypothetical protein
MALGPLESDRSENAENEAGTNREINRKTQIRMSFQYGLLPYQSNTHSTGGFQAVLESRSAQRHQTPRPSLDFQKSTQTRAAPAPFSRNTRKTCPVTAKQQIVFFISIYYHLLTFAVPPLFE